jgi:hypothetical protein
MRKHGFCKSAVLRAEYRRATTELRFIFLLVITYFCSNAEVMKTGNWERRNFKMLLHNVYVNLKTYVYQIY